MKKIWLTVFFALSTIQVIGILSGVEILRTCSKPLLMPVLALWLINATTGVRARLRSGWLIGLFFSTLGDIFLMNSSSMFFILGLLAFLLAHLAYIGSIAVGMRGRRGFLIKNPIWILPFVLYPVLMLYGLWDGIPDMMRGPVAIYALVIATMALSVLHLRGYIAEKAFSTMMGGALLFVLSDSLLALDKFGAHFSFAPLAIMITYIAGQWLLAKGVATVLKA
jgi:uncharacterized membrane protein YhhN